MNPAEQLLTLIIDTVEEQIIAVRSMDIERLKEMTARRQDLVFELDLEHRNNTIRPTVYLKELAEKLEQQDVRFMAILETVANATKMAGVGKRVAVYGADGHVQR